MSETILRSSLHVSLVSHSAVAFTSPLSGLERPVVASGSGVGVCALGTGLLLDVVGLLAASPASGVDFRVTLTETLGTFASRHCGL